MAEEAGPLRILFLDSWHTDRVRGSGSAVAIAGLAVGLREIGHAVTTLRPRRVLPSHDATRLLYNLELRRRIRPSSYDLIVGFDFDGCWLRAPGAPYVVALKGVMADELRHERGWNRVRFSFLARLERRNARRADRVIVTSEYSRRTAMRAYRVPPERMRIVPEGIDVAWWADCVERETRRGSSVVLTVARQYRRKNTATLLRAMPTVRRSVPQARLRVVGEGPELARLRSLAASLKLDESAVEFAGPVAGREAIRRELLAADVFCLPSRQEGFGIVFLEAMATGLPIVAARAGAVPEIVPHGEAALLVDPDDPAELADAIVRLLTDEALRRRLVEAGAERWRSYGWSLVAERFVEAALSVRPCSEGDSTPILGVSITPSEGAP